MRYGDIEAKYKIDIISFLRNYLGISDSSLKQDKLTHRDLRVLFPYLNLERIPYNDVYKDLENVYNGNYLIVYDSKHEIIVYKNPLLMDYTLLPSSEFNYDGERKTIELPNLRGLSKEELLKLRREVKRTQEYQKERQLLRMIRDKKRKEPRDYKREKTKLKMKDYDWSE